MNVTTLRRIVYCLLFIQLLFAQEQEFKIPDSLKNKTYPELAYGYYQYLEVNSKEVLELYAKTYIAKAKYEKDRINIAEGFYYLAYISESDLALSCMDSIIAITKDMGNNKYPSTAYLFKGFEYRDKRAFDKALDNYIKANEYARKNYNPELLFRSSFNIGDLKNRIGNYKEALAIYKEVYHYADKNLKRSNHSLYLSTIFSMVTSFYRLKEMDSASFYSNLGIIEAIKSKNADFYNYLVLSSGVISHLKQNHIAALDSIHKSLKHIEEIDDRPNRAVAYYYLGKIYYETGSKEQGIYYLKKLDTIFQEQKDIHPETRDGYEILINHYKKNQDKENQLLYIEKLLEVDSVLYGYYRYLQKNIVQHYDTPLLLEEKNEIINTLEKGRLYYYIGIIGLTLISILTAVFWILNYRKRKIYKKRFEALLNKTNEEKKDGQKATDKAQVESVGISEEVVAYILSRLDKFETKKAYLKPNITTISLAKTFNTNSKYLSRIVNIYKKKSFSLYINELRIDYVVEKLQADKRLRTYTINAIAREIGFNTAEAFSKAFLKKTGIYPSYFIKELEKRRAA